MTNEEAISYIRDILAENNSIKPSMVVFESEKEALRVAIKALEQQFCDDCISREAVNVLVDELARAISDERCCISRGRSTATIMQDILDLSSVQPTRPTGKWIDIGYEGLVFKYSLCGIKKTIESHFCPNCGARMAESEEAEE